MASTIAKVVTPLVRSGPTYSFKRTSDMAVFLVAGGRAAAAAAGTVGFRVDVLKWVPGAAEPWVFVDSFKAEKAVTAAGSVDVSGVKVLQVTGGLEYSLRIALLPGTILPTDMPQGVCSVIVIDADAPPGGAA